jgi:hypothetical protein
MREADRANVIGTGDVEIEEPDFGWNAGANNVCSAMDLTGNFACLDVEGCR